MKRQPRAVEQRYNALTANLSLARLHGRAARLLRAGLQKNEGMSLAEEAVTIRMTRAAINRLHNAFHPLEGF